MALTYVEEVKGSAGAKGDITIPEVFSLGIRPFKGMVPCELKARFRYRINGGQLSMLYKLHRPGKIADADIVEEIEECTKAPLIVNASD
ncbi:MAG: DUF2303 family protein [Pseudomonadota bacterium]|nr:DUF2303 family protein [Pseudomonadota bacterium]